MTISGNAYLQLKVDLTQTKSIDLTDATMPLTKIYKNILTNGTGNDQINQVWSDQRTLTASSTEDIDLDGSLTDIFGNTITFTSIKAMIIKAAAANTNDVLVGGAAANQFVNWVSDATDVLVVPPDGLFMLTAPNGGFAVTAGTGDALKIANSAGGTSVTYDIVLLGVD